MNQRRMLLPSSVSRYAFVLLLRYLGQQGIERSFVAWPLMLGVSWIRMWRKR